MTDETKAREIDDEEGDDTPAPPRRHRHPERFIVQAGDVEVRDADGNIVKPAAMGKKSDDEPISPPDDPHA